MAAGRRLSPALTSMLLIAVCTALRMELPVGSRLQVQFDASKAAGNGSAAEAEAHGEAHSETHAETHAEVLAETNGEVARRHAEVTESAAAHRAEAHSEAHAEVHAEVHAETQGEAAQWLAEAAESAAAHRGEAITEAHAEAHTEDHAEDHAEVHAEAFAEDRSSADAPAKASQMDSSAANDHGNEYRAAEAYVMMMIERLQVPAHAKASASSLAASAASSIAQSSLQKTNVSLQAKESAVRAAVASGDDLLSKLVLEPEFLLLFIYVLLFILCAVKIWMHSSSDVMAKSAEVRSQRDALQGSYMKSVKEIEGILAGMTESSAYLAEWNFEERRSKFEKFVERVRDKPSSLAESKETQAAMVQPLRTFMGMWLSIFEQCSPDPENHPRIIATEDELANCQRLSDLAGMVADKLSKNTVTFMKNWVQRWSKKDYNLHFEEVEQSKWLEFGSCGFGITRGALGPHAADDDDDEDSDREEVEYTPSTRRVTAPTSKYPIELRFFFVKAMVLSPNHMLLLGAFAIGFLVVVSQLLAAHWQASLFVFLLQSALAFMLFRIHGLEEVTLLQLEILRLQALSEEVRENHEQLKDFYAKVRKLGILWRYRTIPCLEHFQELHHTLLSVQDRERVEFLVAINDAWEPKLDGLGDIHDWLGDDSIGEDFLKLACTQLNLATEYVIKNREQNMGAIVKRVNQVFGFLVVRILCSFNLKNKAPLGQYSNPYCVLSIDQKGGKAVGKTRSVSGDLNPRWGQECFIPVGWSAKMIEFEVLDDQKKSDDNPSLGYLDVKFRELEAGRWHRRKQCLWSKKKQTEQKAELMYELFFADELRQLRDLDSQEQTSSSSFASASARASARAY